MRTQAASVRGWDPSATLRRAEMLLDLGFEKLTLEEPLHAPSWEALQRMLPRESVAALRLFIPYPGSVRVASPSLCHLGFTDADDRREMLKRAEQSLLAAAGSSIPRVLLPPAPLEEAAAVEPPDRGRSPPGRTDDPGLRRLLDSFRSTLDRLLGTAERYSIRLCVTPSSRSDEAPDLVEALGCLREFEGAPLSLWLDTVRLPPGLEVAETDQGSPELRCPGEARLPVEGLSIHDHSEGRDGGLPGSGDIDWEALDGILRASPIWALDAGVDVPLEELARGKEILDRLEGRGMAGPPEAIFPH